MPGGLDRLKMTYPYPWCTADARWRQLREGLAKDWQNDVRTGALLIEAIEALVDDHWATEADHLAMEAERSPALRTALGRCMFDPRTPENVVARFESLARGE